MEEAAKETVIIVHGTFAAPKPGASRWYQPTEDRPAIKSFVVKLNDALQKRGSAARCWAHCSQGDQGFYWSGDNSWVARTGAAAELGSYVLNLRNDGWCCHATQVMLVKDDNVIQTFAADRTDEALDIWVLPR